MISPTYIFGSAALLISLLCVGMMYIFLNIITTLFNKINSKMDKSEALCKEGVKEMDILLTKMHRELDGLQPIPNLDSVKEKIEKAKQIADRAAVLCEEIKQTVLTNNCNCQ